MFSSSFYRTDSILRWNTLKSMWMIPYNIRCSHFSSFETCHCFRWQPCQVISLNFSKWTSEILYERCSFSYVNMFVCVLNEQQRLLLLGKKDTQKITCSSHQQHPDFNSKWLKWNNVQIDNVNGREINIRLFGRWAKCKNTLHIHSKHNRTEQHETHLRYTWDKWELSNSKFSKLFEWDITKNRSFSIESKIVWRRGFAGIQVEWNVNDVSSAQYTMQEYASSKIKSRKNRKNCVQQINDQCIPLKVRKMQRESEMWFVLGFYHNDY